MRIDVDQENCCGAGTCVQIAPDVFDQREDDGLVVLLDREPPDDLHPAVQEAAALCPASVIFIDAPERRP